jgi:hypothetical protein
MLLLLTTAQVAAREPKWMDRFGGGWELSAGAVVGADFAGGPALAGLSLRAGAQWNVEFGDERFADYALFQTAFGNAWGVEMRLTTLGSTRGPTTFAAGLALTATHALVLDGWRGRLRVPSLVGLITPEVGLATRPALDSAVYAAWSAPFAVLLTDSLGLELTPRAFVVYGARTEAIGLLSLSLVRRQTQRESGEPEREDREPPRARPVPTPKRTPDYVVQPAGPGRAKVTIGSGRSQHDLTFVREASPVTTTLRAIAFDEQHAYAVGDGGVILERQPRSQWRLEPSGTVRDLRAIARVGSKTRRTPDAFVAVGDGGTIVQKGDRDGAWHVVPSPTDGDLLAVTSGFIAGAHGLMLAWADGRWRRVETGVDEDLQVVWDCAYNEPVGGGTRFHDAVCAAGRRGRLLRCIISGLSVDCAPRPSPTTSDLYATNVWPLIFGADGTVLQGGQDYPHDYVLLPPLPMGDVYAAAENHALPQIEGSVNVEDRLAIGARGAVVPWLGWEPFSPPVTLDPSVDLFGVATRALDWFIVGSGGAIFHGAGEHLLIFPFYAL